MCMVNSVDYFVSFVWVCDCAVFVLFPYRVWRWQLFALIGGCCCYWLIWFGRFAYWIVGFWCVFLVVYCC